MTTTHPTGRMLKRALPDPNDVRNSWTRQQWINDVRERFPNFCDRDVIETVNSILKPRGYSLNTTGVQFRVRQLQWDCIRFRKGLGELYTPAEQNDHLAKPVTKKDILNGYLTAGRYGNFKTPRI